MTECKVYSSLFALVNSHLSSLSLQENQSDIGQNSLQIPSTNVVNHGSESEANIASTSKQTIPRVHLGDSPISQILATQVTNMLIAKEKRQEEEQKRLEKEKMKIEDDTFATDLLRALREPVPKSMPSAPKSISSSGSCERLFDMQFMEYLNEDENPKKPEPTLPCITDMSYILNVKLPKRKCSPFGKVLTSRTRPVPGVYIREKFDSNIKVFTFDTPSPCDLIKEKLRKPTISCSYIANITD